MSRLIERLATFGRVPDLSNTFCDKEAKEPE